MDMKVGEAKNDFDSKVGSPTWFSSQALIRPVTSKPFDFPCPTVLASTVSVVLTSLL
jgi:hypothetical protein